MTEDNANQSKGARGTSEYMPPFVSYNFEYVRKWRFLANKYELELDQRDADLITSTLSSSRLRESAQ